MPRSAETGRRRAGMAGFFFPSPEMVVLRLEGRVVDQNGGDEMNGSAAPESLDELEPGTSFVLTAEGWERVEYQEPGPDWRLRSDGSFESPDGLTVTWPIDPPTGD